MRHHARIAAALAAASLLAASFVAATPAAADDPLRAHAAARGKFIGYAAATGPLANEAAYRSLAAAEFNQVTAENAMKWDATEPSDGSWNFAGADQVVAFAQQNAQQVHGHTLVWHSQTPSWVQGLGAAALRTAMQDHIATLVGRYAANPAVVSWDVVNEVFDDNGGLRSSFWLNTLGQSYIADAFRYARAADPDARLCINDYNVEGINAKSTAMYDLVRTLRSQGVPVDCVGFQGHLAIQYGFPRQFRQNLERFAALGVQVRITELDVRMTLPRDATKDATQASYYRQVVEACLAVPACAGVTIWGFTDRYSWVPDTFSGQGAALPYDANYAPKPAYTAVHDTLAGGSGPGPSPSASPSPSPSASPSPSPGGGSCRVAYTINPWGGGPGFTAGVVVTNTGAAPVSGWTLAFTLPAGQRVTPPGWSANWAQAGQAVTATPLSWNGTLPPGGATSIGFNGSHTGNTSEPAAFTLNGQTCVVA
jgi:endo-1,4-beta-xylanase